VRTSNVQATAFLTVALVALFVGPTLAQVSPSGVPGGPAQPGAPSYQAPTPPPVVPTPAPIIPAPAPTTPSSPTTPGSAVDSSGLGALIVLGVITAVVIAIWAVTAFSRRGRGDLDVPTG